MTNISPYITLTHKFEVTIMIAYTTGEFFLSLHGNVYLHSARKTQKIRSEFSWPVLPDAIYSPDFAQTHYYLLRPLRNVFIGGDISPMKRFSTSKLAVFCTEFIDKLPKLHLAIIQIKVNI